MCHKKKSFNYLLNIFIHRKYLKRLQGCPAIEKWDFRGIIQWQTYILSNHFKISALLTTFWTLEHMVIYIIYLFSTVNSMFRFITSALGKTINLISVLILCIVPCNVPRSLDILYWELPVFSDMGRELWIKCYRFY